MAVKMNWMVVHSQVDNPDTHATAQSNQHRRSHGTGDTIKRKPVELHVRGVGNAAAGKNGPFLAIDSGVVVLSRLVCYCGVDYQHADHAYHVRHGPVSVIEERAMLASFKFVREQPSR